MEHVTRATSGTASVRADGSSACRRGARAAGLGGPVIVAVTLEGGGEPLTATFRAQAVELAA